MLRRILIAVVLGGVAAALTVGVLYKFFGLRVELDGGGSPHLEFVESAESHAEVVARHRETQRAQFQTEAPSQVPPV